MPNILLNTPPDWSPTLAGLRELYASAQDLLTVQLGPQDRLQIDLVPPAEEPVA